MSSLCSFVRSAIGFSVVAAAVFTLCPAAASAQSVRGQGEISNGPGVSPSHISIDAWIDAGGTARGTMTWIGDIDNTPPYTAGTGGPADPFVMAVAYVEFSGNSALVVGVVIASPGGASNGNFEAFWFTDNRGMGDPDEIDGTPILAGNITVDV